MNYILTRPDFGHNTFYIVDAMKALGQDIKRIKSDAALPADAQWCIRWGCTPNVPGKPKVINKAKAIHETTNKGAFRNKVATNTKHAPRTWLNLQDWFMEMDEVLPVIVRPTFHQRSEHLYFCKTAEDVKAAVRKIGGDYYISEYIAKQKEWRVFVAQGRVMIVAEKLPKDRKAVTWGCVEDGELNYQFWNDWNHKLGQCAIEAFNQSQLDFAAIDIMEKDGEFYFLEANTAPETWKYYGEVFAKVFTYIIKNDNRERIPVKQYTSWKDYIHPSLSPLAVVGK